MPEATTFADLWDYLLETKRLFREQSAETDRKFQETDRKFQETDRRLRESLEKTWAQLQETDRVVKDVSRQIGNLGGKWGQFVENMIAPACETLFAQRGIPVHEVHQRVKLKHDDGRHMEIDIMVVNNNAVVLVEVKSTLTVADVRQFKKTIASFKEFRPLYKDFRVMGAVAGIVIEEQADDYARNQGLFVIAQSGDNVVLANEDTFKPQVW
ncbi:MAG: DUF3782 domain-containing protein [Magnetococcales bacterium]|nr:DUF3782 domain-containing protein [Magnetococcales bacterium]